MLVEAAFFSSEPEAFSGKQQKQETVNCHIQKQIKALLAEMEIIPVYKVLQWISDIDVKLTDNADLATQPFGE